MLYQLSYFRKNIPYQSQPSRLRPSAFSGRRTGLATPTGTLFYQWEVMDSNHRRRKPADLQSAPFGHSGNFPCLCAPFSASGIARRSGFPYFRRNWLVSLGSAPRSTSPIPCGGGFRSAAVRLTQKPLRFFETPASENLCPHEASLSLPNIFICAAKAGVFLLFPRSAFRADGGIRTPDQLITNQLLWPTELHRHNRPFWIAKVGIKNLSRKLSANKFSTFSLFSKNPALSSRQMG